MAEEAAQGGATISEYIFEMIEKARRPDVNSGSLLFISTRKQRIA